MRTTVNLDEDILRAVKSLARERGVSMGDVVSDLIREALRPDQGTAYETGFPVFRVREDAPPITPEMVGESMEDDL